jgi:hypothetical protein
MSRKTVDLRQRGEEILALCDNDNEAASKFVADNPDESAPFTKELIALGWDAVFRGTKHGTRKMPPAPKPRYQNGNTNGTVKETPAYKAAKERYRKAKEAFVVKYVLWGSSITLMNASVDDIRAAKACYKKQIDGAQQQIDFLDDVEDALMKVKGGKFTETDIPALTEIAKHHRLI